MSWGAAPAIGSAPLTVNLTGTSLNGTSWTIDFGDGSAGVSGSGDTSAAVHTYTDPGTYEARLTVSGPGGSDSQSMFITVN